MDSYSVLMSVYNKERPENLKLSMESMWRQTVPTDDFVLVCDGPLTDELDAVISEMKEQYGERLNVVRYESNHGLGYALREGVLACRNELIARMDSDDISRPERCEKELKAFEADNELSIVGGWIEEFTEIEEGSLVPSQINEKRVVPEKQEEIIEFAKTRNPFNHPSVMIRKQAVLDAGNYQDIRYMQDYYLWIHMLIRGAKGYNIQEPLVYMRADSNLFKRRSGSLYRRIQLDLFKYMKDSGFITTKQYIKSCVLRIGASIAPNWLRMIVFKKVLRKK